MPDANDPTDLRIDTGAGRTCMVSFGPLAGLPALMRRTGIETPHCILVTDSTVDALHGDTIRATITHASMAPECIVLPPGESTKSLDALRMIYDRVLARGVERGTPLIALGGGVVGDLAGFAAATLLRGLPLIHVPTTLIAQVDSAIGGKTGINHETGKNLIGAFHAPHAVLIDPEFLRSLPLRQWTSGLAEVVKHGLIAKKRLFVGLESGWDAVLDRDRETVARIVPQAARVKVSIVQEDPFESGRRAILNFGHTFAHAIEKVSGYGTFTHGEAVATGMRAALRLSGQQSPELDEVRAQNLVGRIPVAPDVASLSVEELMEAMTSDKKVRRGRLRFVLLERIGQAFVADGVPHARIEDAWAYALNLA